MVNAINDTTAEGRTTIDIVFTKNRTQTCRALQLS